MKFLDPKLRLVTAFMLASTLAIGCSDRGFQAADIVAPAEKSGEETGGKEAGAEQVQDKSDEAKDTASIALPQVIALQAEYKETQEVEGETSESTIEQITLTFQTAEDASPVEVSLPSFDQGFGGAGVFSGSFEIDGVVYHLTGVCESTQVSSCDKIQILISPQGTVEDEQILIATYLATEDGFVLSDESAKNAELLSMIESLESYQTQKLSVELGTPSSEFRAIVLTEFIADSLSKEGQIVIESQKNLRQVSFLLDSKTWQDQVELGDERYLFVQKGVGGTSQNPREILIVRLVEKKESLKGGGQTIDELFKVVYDLQVNGLGEFLLISWEYAEEIN